MPKATDLSPERLTELLGYWADGDKEAEDLLFAAVYSHLRRLARNQLRGGRRGSLLDTGALIHETYLKLTAGCRVPVRNRAHFLALASRTMRQIVVDHARRSAALKRGGDRLRVSSLPAAPAGISATDLVALDEALRKLEGLEPRLVRIVEMRYFGELTLEETAGALGISVATIKRSWLRARAFLFQHVRPDPVV